MAKTDKTVPVAVSGQYSDESAVQQNISIIFREFQAKKHKLFAAEPNDPDVGEREVVFVDTGAVRRGYVKINGTLYYWALTAA